MSGTPGRTSCRARWPRQFVTSAGCSRRTIAATAETTLSSPAGVLVQRPCTVAERAGVCADLGQRGERVPAVAGGVLHALGHHSAAGLLEPYAELVLARTATPTAEGEVCQQRDLGGALR